MPASSVRDCVDAKAIDVSTTLRQLPLVLGAEAARRFDNFLPDGNEQWPQLLAALSDPQPGAPIYLWGLPGSGKSHLLHACADAAQERGVRVAAFDAATRLPWTSRDDDGLIVLDDCDRFDALQQHAAFTLFVEAASLQIAVVSAGNLPPTDLAVRDDLRSRLGWGWVFQLVAPTEPQVRALLQQAAVHRGLSLTDEVLDYLLRRCARDLSHLMHLLDRLDRFSLTVKRGVTVALVRQMLNDDAAGR